MNACLLARLFGCRAALPPRRGHRWPVVVLALAVLAACADRPPGTGGASAGVVDGALVGAGGAVPLVEVRPSPRVPSAEGDRLVSPVQAADAVPQEGGTFSGVRGFGGVDYAVIGVYLLLLVGLGAFFSRRGRTTDDFFLAGGRVPWWAAGLSIFGTQLSALTFMGLPAKAYAEDWVFVLVNTGILFVAPVVVYFYLPFFRRLRVTTAYEYLEKRFSLAVRLFGSLSFVLYQLGRMGIVVALPAIALATVTGLDVYLCILVMGVLATAYTVLGGIEAVIWTDVLQVIVLVGGAIVSFFLILAHLDGGWGEFVAVAAAADKFHMVNWTWDYTTAALWVVLVGNALASLAPYTTDQAVVQRYLTTKDEGAARRAIWTNAVLVVPATVLFFGVGTALWVFYQTYPAQLSPAFATGELAGDAIFPFFIAAELPPGVSGLVIAGLFAAAMSSLDSSMNSMATAFVTDFYRRLGRGVTEPQALRMAKGLTLGLGVVGTGTALLIASLDVESLWTLFLALVGLFASPLAGVFALGIFTRRATGPGVLVGAVVSALVLYAVQRYTDVHLFLYAAVGLGVCVGVGYLASLLRPGPARDLAGLTIYTMQPEAPAAPPRRPVPG